MSLFDPSPKNVTHALLDLGLLNSYWGSFVRPLPDDYVVRLAHKDLVRVARQFYLYGVAAAGNALPAAIFIPKETSDG